MTARRIVLSAALLGAVAVLPVHAQDPPAAPEPKAAQVRVAVERAPRGERREPAATVGPPRSTPAAPSDEAQPRRKPDPLPTTTTSASAAAAADDDQGGRRSGNRGSGRVTRGDRGAAPRQGGVRNPDIDRGPGAVAQAVPRSRAPRPSGSWGGGYPGRRYFTGARGFGYYVYDPWSWYGYGYGWPGYGGYYGSWNGGWGGGYGGGWGGGYYAGPYGWSIGGVRLKVDPNDAEVYVDGYYAGIVDDFDGIWQQLRLDDGGHRVEVRKRGFESLVFDVHIQPGRTITYRGHMVPGP